MTQEEKELQELKELEELAELEALEALEAGESDPSLDDPAVIDPEAYSQPAEKPQTMAEAAPMPSISEAASTGIVTLPFVKDAMAGYTALRDTMSGEEELSVDALTEKYKRERKDIDDTVSILREKRPYVTGASEFITNAALSATPGINTLKGAAGLGALYGLSNSEERTLSSALEGAGTSSALYGLGVFGAHGLKKLKVGMLPKSLKGKGLDKSIAESTKEAIAGLQPSKLRKINEHLEKTGQSAEDFSNTFFRKDMDFFKQYDSFEETLSKVRVSKDKVGKQIDDIVEEIQAQSNLKIDPKQVQARLNTKLDNIYKEKADLIPEFKDRLNEMKEYVQQMTIGDVDYKAIIVNGKEKLIPIPVNPPKDLTLPQLNLIKKGLAEMVYEGKGDVALKAVQKRTGQSHLISELIDVTEEFIGNKGDKATLDLFKRSKKDYANLVVANELLTDTVNSKSKGLWSAAKDFVSMRATATGLFLSSAGLPAPVSIGLASALNKSMNSEAFPATAVAGMKKLQQYIVSNPDSKIVRSLLVAGGLTDEEFGQHVSSAISKVSLMEAPLDRTTNNTKANSSKIAAILEVEHPERANQFRELIEAKDDVGIAAFMDRLAKDPKTKELIKPGIGWDGKVYDPADKDFLRNEIKKSPAPYTEKLQQQELLDVHGVIPTPSQSKPYYKEFKPRNKKALRY